MILDAKKIFWEEEKTEPELNIAIKTLNKRFNFVANDGAAVVFVKGALDRVTLGDRIVVEYTKICSALRFLGLIVVGLPCDGVPIKTLGIMLDVSRNGVKTVEFVKEYLCDIALMGYNMLMLYTEDTYILDAEPFFGYQRGAYTRAEIAEIDDFAASLGIELIPCIEVLAHLDQIFKWCNYGDIRDKDGILLVDEEKTYALIEKMIAFWSSTVRSRRIHLGMDEAHGLGTGKHEEIYGKESQFDIINRHLLRCVSLCEKYGQKPMIWADMYFRIGSKTGSYYDLSSVTPDSVISGIPENLELVYWDYYTGKTEQYEAFIRKHKALNRPVLMGSGVWTWNRFWYDEISTQTCVPPCIQACKNEGINEIFFTMWGDNGGFCDYRSALCGLLNSASLAYSSTLSSADLEAFSLRFFGTSFMQTAKLGKVISNVSLFVFDDPLMLHYSQSLTCDTMSCRPFSLTSLFTNLQNLGDASSITPYSAALTSFLTAKADYALLALQSAHANTEKADAPILIEKATALLASARTFYDAFRTMWFSQNKPFGFESTQIRLGGQILRTEELLMRLSDFASSIAHDFPEFAELRRLGKSRPVLGYYSKYLDVALGTTIF